jgi:hypothetical protein
MNDSERDMMLARIDENVLHLKATVGDHQNKDDALHAALNGRLNSLEAARSRQKGAIAASTAIASALWAGLLAAAGFVWSK